MPTNLFDLEPQRRDAMLNAALKEFALKGFDKASTNMIAREAGISKALMFHYIKNKQELFLFVCEYFTELFEKEYVRKLDLSNKDIFDRLRQSYLLQIPLIRQYPGILDVNKLFRFTSSEEVNKVLEKRNYEKHSSCCRHIFDQIDASKFRAGLDIDQCKQFILWSNIGFTNDILKDIQTVKDSGLDEKQIISALDHYLNELRKIFYNEESADEDRF